MRLPTPLRRSRVLELLGAEHPFADLRLLGRVGSTSDLLLELGRCGAARDGTVLVAESQDRGRGRRGTPWDSPAGLGIWCSILLRSLPDEARRALLPLVAGVAAARAIRREPRLPAMVKWPNDVLVGFRKVGGVLVELQGRGAEAWTVLGIGLNANQQEPDLPAQAPLPAGSLALAAGHPVDRERLLAALLSELAAGLQQLEEPGAPDLLEGFRELDGLAGRPVVAREGDRLVEGLVLRVEPLEGLILRTTSGEERLRAAHTRVLLMGRSL